jgi:exopolysaccharide biosynthesis predicted pyruvyltransferase EpsI
MWSQVESEIEVSRQKIFAAIAGYSDLTLIRGFGNMGDELIFAGTRQLLSALKYREVSITDLAGVQGELGLITGGGSWCGPYQYMVEYLPQIERQFKRVIILPSSYDPAVPVIRRTLSQSSATFFARELVSYEQIRSICRAELAHDCAFFFDFRPYRIQGGGLLTSFRTDRESVGLPLPPENNDLSLTCETLDEWLRTIARYEVVHTDRAHVMIAAAMLGKHVRFRSSNYHKIPGIAEFSLRSLPVRKINHLDPAEVVSELQALDEKYRRLLPPELSTRDTKVEVTTVVRKDHSSHEFAENLSAIPTRYALLLDADVEPLPGALAQLLSQFEAAPDVVAVTGCLVTADGTIEHCGANYQLTDRLIEIDLLGRGRRYDDPLGGSSLCRLIPGGMMLVRTEALQRDPLDPELGPDLDVPEWSYRLDCRGEGRLFRSIEALAVRQKPPATSIESRLNSLAHFLRKHGLIIDTLFELLPELGPSADPNSLGAGKLLLILLNQCGVKWVMERWRNNDLAPLFKTVSAREKTLQKEVDSLRLQLIEAHENYAAITRTKSWKLLTLHWRLRQAMSRSGAVTGKE